MANSSDQSADRLLWLAAGVVVLMGLAWLVVATPWSGPDSEAFDDFTAGTQTTDRTLAADNTPDETQTAPVESAPARSDPLHMARMALDAGMLIEPANYSAWTLYGRIVVTDPDNEAARDGLDQVASALLQRGDSALEQGRYDDASAIVATISERLPNHPGALALAAEVERALTPPEPVVPPVKPQLEVASEEPEPVDPIPDLNTAFLSAMADNAVLRPAGTSAVDTVRKMLSAAPEHELTIAARDLLVTEMLDRSIQSIEALDTRAAQTWIDSAAPLSNDPAAIARAQDRLTQQLIDIEAQRVLPASELNQLNAVSPEFPRIPLERGIEGWVEVEFSITTSGSTDDVRVSSASHERYFREEAVAAVEEWRFEPVIFMGRPIPKRSYARLAFVID